MPLSKELFLSILSMDAYNRGYNTRINFGPTSEAINTAIGNATIAASQREPDAVSAGFYGRPAST
jgi:hypothetical protein